MNPQAVQIQQALKKNTGKQVVFSNAYKYVDLNFNSYLSPHTNNHS